MLVLIFLLAATAARADISVRATVSPQRAQVGEPVMLAIDINGAQNVSAPALGSIDGFDVRYVGPSTQISIVNGQMTAAIQHRYSLLPVREGHFTIGPFTVDYQGKQYQTAAVPVDIVAGQPPAAASQGGAPDAPRTPAGNAPRSLRLTLSVPRQEVYFHERLPVDITLYVGPTTVGEVQYPTLSVDGLSLEKFGEPSQHRQVINGEAFDVVHFQTTVVPLRSGSLTLGPATLQLNVLNRRRGQAFNDPFFERFFQNDPFTTERRPFTLRSDPVTLTVLPLPEEGKPSAFSGAVGTFTMQVSAAPTELNAGDPITLRVAITGSGNLADVSAPGISDTEEFRTYEPRAGKAEGSGTSISKTFEQVLMPKDASVHLLPPVRFGYFDPQTHHYRTIESEPIALTVRAAKEVTQSEIVGGGAATARSAPEEKLGRDIVYIKDEPGTLSVRSQRWYGSILFLLWQPVPLLLFVAAVGYDRHRQRLSGDIRYARFSRAGKEARRGLAIAERALTHGDRQAFYDAVSRTMQDYLAAKLDLPPGGIDADAVCARGVPPDCLQRITEFFATCEQVRFAPGTSDGDMRGTLSLAQEVIKRLERERRLVPSRPLDASAPRITATVWVLVVCSAAATHAAQAEPASPQTTFFHANALYKDGDYTAAANEYERLLAAGVESGNVYFNLGNAYFKAGEKGRAILNYERARRSVPSDPDVLANLAYAQSLTGAEACAPPLWKRLAFPLAHRLPTARLVWATSGCYTFLLFALGAWRLWPRRPRGLLYVATTLAALTLIAATSLAQQVLSDDQRRGVVVNSGETAARFEPAENGTAHFVLKEGALVRVLDTRQGWLQVARCDGRRGWVERQAVETLEDGDARTGRAARIEERPGV